MGEGGGCGALRPITDRKIDRVKIWVPRLPMALPVAAGAFRHPICDRPRTRIRGFDESRFLAAFTLR